MNQFYSTHNPSFRASFEEAVKLGLAPSGGLFMPETIAPLAKEFWQKFPSMNFQDMAFEVSRHFLQGALTDQVLHQIVEHTLEFDAPLIEIEKNIFSLELFHGPTLAFKDFGARFLAGVLGHYATVHKEEITILVATSGDTGSAVAHGFYNQPGIRVIVLYPSGKVSELQEKQFATLGGNVTALEIDGTFDDCQRLVKEAFSDQELKSKRRLTSANSINMARLVPQMFYYFRAFQQLPAGNLPVVVSVPSGNFGNLTAGLMAQKMGLPVDAFVAATNINDVVPAYLQSQKFLPRPSRSTISNAMDVGNPSNFPRMLELHSYDELARRVTGYGFTDEETSLIMASVYRELNYLLDPHGAVGYLGLKKYVSYHGEARGIFLETAHPGKFKEVVENAIGEKIELPDRLVSFMSREKKSFRMQNNFDALKRFLSGL